MLQSFALAKNGNIVSVADVERGLACNCICPACKEVLIAKQGDVRVWHFAHASGTECLGGAESALHHAAKHLIEKWHGMMMPEIRARKSFQLLDRREATEDVCIGATWIDFEQVSLEESIGAIRPDLIAQIGATRYLIEIAVTHFVDHEKLSAIEMIGLPALEISLNLMGRGILDWAALEEAVIHGTTVKAWLFHPVLKDLEALALDKAAIAASKQPPSPAPKTSAPRMRILVNGRIVDLIDRPFGVAVWTPYNPEINEITKTLARSLGGKYQPKYKNWLFPLSVRPWLLQALQGEAESPTT